MVIREYVRGLVLGSTPGAPAPSERELVDRFGVARMTVRQALDTLVSEGILERFPGRGTFVARPRRIPSGITSFTEDMHRRGAVVESRTLVAERVPASNAVARGLDIGVRQPVIHWRRLRLADGRPVCVSDAYLSDALLPGLLDGLPDSLYDELTARGRRPTWVEDSMSAGLASEEDAETLEVPQAAVVMWHSRRGLWGDRPIELSRSVYPADQHTFWLQFSA